MENQHRKIAGYRELDQQEINLMNRIKARGEELGVLIEELRELRNDDRQALIECMDVARLNYTQINESAVAINTAERYLKTGVMWLVRAIALPTTF